jgi:Tol biopolymer transport system component
MKTVIRVALLACSIIVGACSKSIPRTLLDELTQKQQKEHVTIGWVSGQKLEALHFDKTTEMRDYQLTTPSLFAATLDGYNGTIFGAPSDPKQNELVAVRDGAIIWRVADLAIQQNPVVAPGGSRLAVYGRQKKEKIDGLYLVEDQGQEIILVSRSAEGASWSDDATKLLYNEGSQIVIYDLQSKQTTPIAQGTLATWSPNGKWITYRTPAGKFVLADTTGKIQRDLLDSKNILTGLSWSPDSEFLMYVEKAGAWGGPCARNFAEGRDVMVYRLRDAQKGKVFQVCDGFPYQQLDWIRVPSAIPLT